MARSMKVEDLLLQTSKAEEHSQKHSPSRTATQLHPVPKPNYHRLSHPARDVDEKPPTLNLLTWDLPSEAAISRAQRKRKASSDQDGALIRRSARLPRFSVNVFNAEPANVYPIPFQGIVPRMIKYYLQSWAPQHGRAFAVEGHPKPYTSLVYPHALQHGVLLEAMVCIARASWLLTEGIPWQYDKPLAYHRANAFQKLAIRISSENTCADDTTILTIAALSTVDFMLGIHEGAENHIHAMDRIWKMRTDITGNTPWEQFLLVTQKAYDQLWKFVRDRNEAMARVAQLSIESPLRNELPRYPSLPFNTRVCEALSKTSTTFNDIAMAGELSIQVIDILANLSSIAKYGTITSPIDSPRASPESRRNLLHAIDDLCCLAIMGTTAVEHFLCYGLIGCCFTLHFDCGLIGAEYNESMQMIENTLLGDAKRLRQGMVARTHPECMIWILIAAAGALAVSELHPVMFRVLDRAFTQFPKETTQWEPLAKILQKFLWNDDILSHWERCWRAARSRNPRFR